MMDTATKKITELTPTDYPEIRAAILQAQAEINERIEAGWRELRKTQGAAARRRARGRLDHLIVYNHTIGAAVDNARFVEAKATHGEIDGPLGAREWACRVLDVLVDWERKKARLGARKAAS